MYNGSGIGHWTKLSYFIKRNDSFEIVTSAHFSNDTSIYRITWTGSCEYKWLLLNPKNNFDSFLIQKYPLGTSNEILKATNDDFIVKNYGNTRDTIWQTK